MRHYQIGLDEDGEIDDEVFADAVHVLGYVQPEDPLFDAEEPLATGMAWYDTTEGRLKFRNPENNGWITPGAA